MCQVLQRMGLQHSLSTKVEGVVAEIREAVATAERVKQEEAARAGAAKAESAGAAGATDLEAGGGPATAEDAA
eukprot:694437-Pyramimonas_sp.AAC.1